MQTESELIRELAHNRRWRIERPSVHESWGRYLRVILDPFPEVIRVVYVEIRSSGRHPEPPVHLMLLVIRDFLPVFRIRELELYLRRLFETDEFRLRFCLIRENSIALNHPEIRRLDQKGMVLFEKRVWEPTTKRSA